MALHVRACLLKEINGWDETALHDHLRAHSSLRQHLGFEALPNQSTLWRAWNERFSAELRDVVQECADSIVRAARACEVPLPTGSAPTSQMNRKPTTVLNTNSSPQRPTRCGSRPNRSSMMRSRSSADQTGRFTRTRSGNSTPTWGCARTCMLGAVQPRSFSIQRASASHPDRPIATRSGNSRFRKFERCSETRRECSSIAPASTVNSPANSRQLST
nr:hypothetical protein [Natrialba sp. PRR66]